MNSLSRALPALTLALSSAFLLAGYESVRSASNTLFKLYYGTDNLPLLIAGMPVFVLVFLYAYGKALSSLGPRWTLLSSTIFSGAVLTSLYFLLKLKWGPASILLYYFREAYIVMLLEQYWSFINSYYKAEEAKRYNGWIIGISSMGAIGGALLMSSFVKGYGTEFAILFAGLCLIPTAFLADRVFRQGIEPVQESSEEKNSVSETIGLQPFFKTPLLVALMAFVVLSQIVATNLTLNFQTILQEQIPDPDTQTAYSLDFFARLNAAAAFAQFLLVPLALKWISPMKIQLLVPLLNLGMGIAAFFSPSLSMIGASLLTFKALDYSFFRASKEMLYIPLSFDIRYRSKELIDVFGYRAAKGTTSVALSVAKIIGLPIKNYYAGLAILAAGIWAAVVVYFYRRGDLSNESKP